jgi:hypothetical protein
MADAFAASVPALVGKMLIAVGHHLNRAFSVKT